MEAPEEGRDEVCAKRIDYFVDVVVIVMLLLLLLVMLRLDYWTRHMLEVAVVIVVVVVVMMVVDYRCNLASDADVLRKCGRHSDWFAGQARRL